jgi:hypothetical protein
VDEQHPADPALRLEVLGEITLEEKVSLLRRAKAVLFPIDWPSRSGS